MNVPMSERPVLAVFDFDGTLTKRDSLPGFLLHACGPLRAARAFALELPAVLEALRHDEARDFAKERIFARAFAGLDAEAVDEAARAYAHRVVETGLRSDVRAKLEWHRAQGHALCIVSASLEPYLKVVAERLGVGHLACTHLEVGADGKLTGAMVGGNCRRAEKVARLRTLLEPEHFEIWAYGDSKGDTELLALADHPVWV
jgi:HAD superfamily hydrolase (TIGR01490 family)